MPKIVLPIIEPHDPGTFLSRGVAAPFTTPFLAGARVRRSSKGGVDLVAPNPSGGRGVYVVQWPGVRALCNPTVHDTMLFKGIQELEVVDTASIREAALDIALAGHAGHAAAAAAEAAREADRSQRLLAHYLLLMAITDQVEPDGPRATVLAKRTPEMDRRISVALHKIAPAFGRSVAQLVGGLAVMGDAFAPLGVAADNRAARVPRLLHRLEETCADLLRWVSSEGHEDFGDLGRAATASMAAAHRSGVALLKATRAPLSDMVAFLRGWFADPMTVATASKRCDLLLDGWERVALLWMSASTDALRRATLLEMIPLLPVLPREAMDWADAGVLPEAMQPACRVTSHDNAWRNGAAAVALVERNEALRALGG